MRTWRAGHILHTQYQVNAQCPFMNPAAMHTAHKRLHVEQLWWHGNQSKACQILSCCLAVLEQSKQHWRVADWPWQAEYDNIKLWFPPLNWNYSFIVSAATPLSQCFKIMEFSFYQSSAKSTSNHKILKSEAERRQRGIHLPKWLHL